MTYTPIQLIFFFFVYCFIGWIIETTWVSLHQKKFVNRGFMRGPFIPIYGFGAMTLLLSCTFLLKWPVAVFFTGMIAASVLEYFTGVAMEAIFKVRYWDYSSKKFNINGHVCLFNSLCWGVLAVGENYFMHKPVAALSEWMGEKALTYVTMAIAVYFFADLSLAFKAAFDLRDLIIAMDKAKNEMRIMQKRLDVMLAYANEDFEEQKEKVGEKIAAIYDGVGEKMDGLGVRIEDISESVEEKLIAMKKAMEEKPAVFAENVRNEYAELTAKFQIHKENQFGLTGITGYKKGLVKGNPSIMSNKFKGTVESIKNYVSDKKSK